MKENQILLDALLEITRISNLPKIDFQTKLQRIIHEIAKCMNTERASIMLKKGRSHLVVAASTAPDLVGHKVSLDSDSPSARVVQNKEALYVKDNSDKHYGYKQFDNYQKNAFLLSPILVGNKVIGVISITEKIGLDCYSPKEQEGFVLISGYILSTLENHRLTESLQKSKRSLYQKNQKLKRLEKIRTELFNMLIHDLKGPVSEVIANLDILTYTVKERENLDYINAAQSASDTLYRMVADLLDIARLEEGNLPIVFEKIKPRELMEEALSRIHGLARIKGLKLVQHPHADTDNITVKADRELLLRVLQNLLTNAVDHSVAEEVIELGCRYVDAQNLQIYIQDNGPGIPEEYKESIFEKFTQIGKRRDGRIYTSGLGLTFCKLAVEAHHGRIAVESDGVKGSCFTFTIPIQ